MTERDDTLEEIACYIDDSKEAAHRMGKLPLVAALEVMVQEVRGRKSGGSSPFARSETGTRYTGTFKCPRCTGTGKCQPWGTI